MLWYLSAIDIFTVFSIFAALSYICGWISDTLLSRVGFGTLGNGIVILLGAFAGMFAYNLQGKYLFYNAQETYFVIGIAAFSSLFIMAVIKRLIMH